MSTILNSFARDIRRYEFADSMDMMFLAASHDLTKHYGHKKEDDTGLHMFLATHKMVDKNNDGTMDQDALQALYAHSDVEVVTNKKNICERALFKVDIDALKQQNPQAAERFLHGAKNLAYENIASMTDTIQKAKPKAKERFIGFFKNI